MIYHLEKWPDKNEHKICVWLEEIGVLGPIRKETIYEKWHKIVKVGPYYKTMQNVIEGIGFDAWVCTSSGYFGHVR